VVMVTHEPDIAQFAKRTILIRDGLLQKDEPVAGRLNARDALRTLPAIAD